MARMEQIYRAIKTQWRPNCSSLAEKLEVSAKTVQRDIDYMRYSGFRTENRFNGLSEIQMVLPPPGGDRSAEATEQE